MADLEQSFTAFQATHPTHYVDAGDRKWSYLHSPGNGPPLLLLGGALGQADFGFLTISALESRFRIVAPTYPAADSLDEMTDGLVLLLDREGIAKAHVVGGSFGGVIAQAFAWRHPDRVAALVLSHAGAPRRVRGRGLAMGLLHLIPEMLLRRLMRKRLRPVLKKADPFWSKQFDSAVASLSSADILSRVRLTAEFSDRYSDGFASPRPTFPVLILDSDDDPLLSAADRQALRRLYPDAETHGFTGTGHIASVLRPKESAAIIEAFVLRAAGPGSA